MKTNWHTYLHLGIFFLLSISGAAQKSYQTHSHNDYLQEFPFWKAYIHESASIEADIFLVEDQLLVAHTEAELSQERTLEALYFKPLSQLAKQEKLRELVLMLDIKSEAVSTLDKLVDVLKEYPSLTDNEKLSLIISGSRPAPNTYHLYPEFIHFDHQNLHDLQTIDLDKVGMISQNFKEHSVWNGLGRLTQADLDAVKEVIEKAAQAKRPIRFWNAPDTKTAWHTFADLGVSYINTDHPAAASAYLESLEKRTHVQSEIIDVYQPTFSYITDSKPKNMIFMIGDGNGLSQISAAMMANRGDLTLAQLKNIGLIKTTAHDDLVTDSAAGATAMATGRKTNNRAIGTGPEGEQLKNLTNLFAQTNYLNGVLTTDRITGATPAAFFAHVQERDDSKSILEDLKQSEVDFFMAAGKELPMTLESSFTQKELPSLTHLEERTAIFLSKEKAQFPKYVKKVLEILDGQDKPYFLVIENGKIDNHGHGNNMSGIITEMLDFDQTIAEVLKIADRNENTLVVITADHETSGMGILHGELSSGKVEGDFLTNDHTGTMVPVFSYGPRSDIFQGVYENTQIFDKILQAMEIKK